MEANAGVLLHVAHFVGKWTFPVVFCFAGIAMMVRADEEKRPHLRVARVEVLGGARVALCLAEPPDVDLEQIYRAGQSVYWNPDLQRLEDRYEGEKSAAASFERVRGALRSEYGMHLEPASEVSWEGVRPEDREKIERMWQV